MLTTTRSTTFCSREPFLKGIMARVKSLCGTTANLRRPDLVNTTLQPHSSKASCDSRSLAGSAEENGQSYGREWERENVRIGCCRRRNTHPLKQLLILKPSRHPRCLARFHG